MKKMKSTITNMVVVLVAVAVVMGAILALVNEVTAAPIAAQKEKTLADGIKRVMQSDDICVDETKDVTISVSDGKAYDFVVYETRSQSGEALGAAVESSVSGFGGNLKVLAGFNPAGELLGYTILEHAETPGLGAKATTWFQADGKGNIIGRSLEGITLSVKQDGGDVDAITASTITSRAFLKAINYAYAAFKGDAEIDASSGASINNSTAVEEQ